MRSAGLSQADAGATVMAHDRAAAQASVTRDSIYIQPDPVCLETGKRPGPW
jgi:hypothetical protein